MIIVWKSLLKNTKINGITLFPFIFLKKQEDKTNAVLINHEKIHLRQQLELLVIFFYLWYVIEYYYWYFKLNDSYLAYKYISFEREAFAMEDDLDYLSHRKLWSFWKYLSWNILGAHFPLSLLAFFLFATAFPISKKEKRAQTRRSIGGAVSSPFHMNFFRTRFVLLQSFEVHRWNSCICVKENRKDLF